VTLAWLPAAGSGPRGAARAPLPGTPATTQQRQQRAGVRRVAHLTRCPPPPRRLQSFGWTAPNALLCFQCSLAVVLIKACEAAGLVKLQPLKADLVKVWFPVNLVSSWGGNQAWLGSQWTW